LMHKGQYTQALEEISNLSHENQLDGLILKSRILERMGELNEALMLTNQAIKESEAKGSTLQKLSAQINQGYAHLSLGNLSNLTEAVQKGEQLLIEIGEEAIDLVQECRGSLAYLQGELNYWKGSTETALEKLENSLLIRQGSENKHNILEPLVLIGWIHLTVTGKLNLAFDYFERSLTIAEEVGNKTDIAHSLNRLGCYYSEKGNFDEALSYFEKSLAIYQDLGNKPKLGVLYNNTAIIYQAKEKYDLAINYYEKFLEISKQLGNQDNVSIIYGNIGWVYGYKGDLDLMLDYCQKGLKIVKEYIPDNVQNTIFLIFSIGNAYFLKGELVKALEYYNIVMDLHREIKSDYGIAWILFQFSDVYSLQGETELAMSSLNQSMRTFQELNNKIGILNCNIRLGIINKTMGNYNNAIKFLEEGLNSYKKIVIGGFTALWGTFILFHLILIAQDLNDPELASSYFKQIKEIEQESKSKFVKLRARFSNAIVLKMSKRGVEKFQAQQIFKDILDDQVIDQNITILSLLNLCELLILEMKISETPEELFQEVNNLSKKMSDIAEAQGSSLLTVMALILQTKLRLVEGEFEGANDLISTAKRIASEKKLGSLLIKVKTEQEMIQKELDKWDSLIQRKASLQERIEHAQITGWLVEAKKIQEAWVRPSVDLINQ
ncbi:MAG: tetratricopeptide repeat protein, partial [Candidatus Hodarchaeota archaeon]